MILINNLLPKEHRQVWNQTRIHADEILQTNTDHPVGAELVPNQDPEWNYKPGVGVGVAF